MTRSGVQALLAPEEATLSVRRILLWGAGLAALTSCEFWILGRASWIYGYGGMLETLPFHLGLLHGRGVWSGWAPFVAGGADRLAVWGNADPLNLEPLLLAILPVWAANGLHAFLQRIVAFVFTALVARDQLRLPSRWPLAAGAAHLAFSYYTFGAMFTSPALPVLVWGFHQVLNQPWRRALLSAAGLGMLVSPLTTFAHGVPYLLAALIGWFSLVTPARTGRALLLLGVCAGALILSEGLQFTALLLQAGESSRSQYSAEPGVTWSLYGLFYLQPEFDLFNQDPWLKHYGQWLPVASAFFLITSRLAGAGSYLAVFGARLACFHVILGMKFFWVTARGIAAFALPWINGIYMGRFFTVAYPLLAGLIVTLALHELFLLLRPRICCFARGAVSAVAALTLLWPKASLWRDLMVNSPGAAALDHPQYQTLRRDDSSVFRVASVLDLPPAYAYANGLEAADGWANLYSGRYRQLWLCVLDPLFQELPANKQIFAPDNKRPQDGYIYLGTSLLNPGLGVLPGEDTTTALREGFDLNRRFRLNLLSLMNVKYLLADHPLNGAGLMLYQAPASPPPAVCRDYATGKVNFPRRPWVTPAGLPDFAAWWDDTRSGFERKLHPQEIYIYENKRVLPRFRCVTRLETRSQATDVLEALARQDVEEMRSTALIAAADRPVDFRLGSFLPAEVEVLAYAADEVRLRVSGSGRRLLIAAIPFNRYWRATASGEDLPLFPVNHAFTAVLLGQREQEIHLEYSPPYR